MSRDFILIFSGGVVSLATTLIVLFIADWMYRREQAKPPQPSHPPHPGQPPETISPPIQEDKSV